MIDWKLMKAGAMMNAMSIVPRARFLMRMGCIRKLRRGDNVVPIVLEGSVPRQDGMH